MLGHPLAATIGDSARCMQNLEKVLFTGPKTSDTVNVYLRLGLIAEAPRKPSNKKIGNLRRLHNCN